MRASHAAPGAVSRAASHHGQRGAVFPQRRLLSLSYEALLSDHAEAMRRLAAFLGLDTAAAAAAAAPEAAPRGAAAPRYSKATPDRLCEAIANYGALCAQYRGTPHARYFDEPCETRCLPKR